MHSLKLSRIIDRSVEGRGLLHKDLLATYDIEALLEFLGFYLAAVQGVDFLGLALGGDGADAVAGVGL